MAGASRARSPPARFRRQPPAVRRRAACTHVTRVRRAMTFGWPKSTDEGARDAPEGSAEARSALPPAAGPLRRPAGTIVNCGAPARRDIR